MAGEVGSSIRQSTPELTAAIDELCLRWLNPLAERLKNGVFRPKQINDAIWGAVELLPWEVALLDAPLLQRMRGVRQLGLAHLVFPGAVHDRLEHIVGVVGAVEQTVATIERQIRRWNRDERNKTRQLPQIEPGDRYRLRLAALFHDVGHGPFSHAIEPVMEVQSPLGFSETEVRGRWRTELAGVRGKLKSAYRLNGSPSLSEIIAVLIVLSDPVDQILRSDTLLTERWAPGPVIQEQLIACIIGAIEGPGADHLSGIISSQLDADRLDYLARDAHHAGLNIGFDTERLLSRLEILQVRLDNTPGADETLRQRMAGRTDPLLQIGIAASGFGSFEQMLIGRTFLYDRLYHHHKVRAAEAMAQRMMLVAERDRAERFSLREIFLSVGDDTMVRIFAEEITHAGLATKSPAAARLASGLINRELLHRAYAFRGRFVSTPPGMETLAAEASRNEQWRRLLKGLDGLRARYELGAEIHGLSLRIARALSAASVQPEMMVALEMALEAAGPEQIIVDLPLRKADSIRIMARYPDGSLKVPEFSFNPVKWADAYDLQKRTGYVFCPREVVPMIAIASRIVFLLKFGVVMGTDADGYIKAGQTVDLAWLVPLVEAGIIDEDVSGLLASRRHSLIALREEDLRVPSKWIEENPDFAVRLIVGLKREIGSGLSALALESFRTVMLAMFAFVDAWYAGGDISGEVEGEADFQKRLLGHMRARSIDVEEGSVVGGGKLDLWVANAVLIENKFEASAIDRSKVAVSAGAQGRRYAISLMSQVVITAAAVRVRKGDPVPQKTDLVEVRPIVRADGNRAEMRFTLPYGASVPSRDKSLG